VIEQLLHPLLVTVGNCFFKATLFTLMALLSHLPDLIVNREEGRIALAPGFNRTRKT